MAAPEEVLFAEPASHTISDQPYTEHPTNLDAHTHSNHMADAGGPEHQSENVLPQKGCMSQTQDLAGMPYDSVTTVPLCVPTSARFVSRS